MRSLTLLLPLSISLLALANPNAAPAPNPAPQVTSAPTLPTDISEDQLSKILSSLSSYENSLVQDPSYSSAISVIATAIPASEIAGAAVDPTGYLQSYATATSTPSWFAALPTEYQNFFSSIGSVEASIVAEVTGKGGSGSGGSSAAAGRVGVGMGLWAMAVAGGVVAVILM